MKRDVDPLYPLILDSIGEGVFSVDPEFHITAFNTEAERITGITRQEAIGRKCYEIFRASICQTSCALRRTITSGQPLRNVRIDVLDRSMDVVPLVVSTAVLRDEQGKLVGGVEIFRDVSEVEALRRQVAGHEGFGEIVGQSQGMRRIFAVLPDVASSDAPVLICGASGTGKELIANAIHDLSPRRGKPFVRVNCGALPDTLLESELFGYVKGAFTDARKDKPGRFVMADGGTLFLDEVGELSPAFQVKLLRVLQEGELQPLGATKSIKVDVRIISATNRDLVAAVEARSFREDLYYRLRVIPIDVPALTSRREDIPPLVERFIRDTAQRTGKGIENISHRALQALLDYDFPGNVRELKNVIERAFVFCRQSTIDVEHLPEELLRARHAPHLPPPPPAPASRPPRPRLDPATEQQRIANTLAVHRWNRNETARALGVGRNTLWRKMKKYGLLRPELGSLHEGSAPDVPDPETET